LKVESEKRRKKSEKNGKKLKKTEKLLKSAERKYTKICRYGICIVSNFDSITVDLYF
jgi:hypothetical protein